MSEQERLQEVASIVQRELLPALSMEGTGIEVVEIDRGVVRVRLSGTCTGCPSAVRAVVMGIEEELRKRLPDVDYLEVVP